MSNARLLVIAFAIAAVAALYTYVAQSFGLVSWISFTCWAAYFLAGGSPKEGWRMFVNWACGVGLGAIIILLATAIGPVLGDTHAYPVAMFIVLVPTLLLENVRFLNMIPFIFFGAISLFALGKPVELATFQTLGTAGVLGIGLGWMTTSMRSSITRFLARHDSTRWPTG